MTFDTEKLEWFDYPMLKNIALPCTVFQLFDIEYYRDLEIWVKGHSRSFKLVYHSKALVRFPICIP